MKKTLLALAVLVGLGTAGAAHAAGYDWLWNLTDSGDTPYVFPLNGSLGDGNPRLLILDGASKQPGFLGIGGVLTVDNGALAVGQLPESQIDNLATDLAAKANASHNHQTSDINGLSTFVSNIVNNATSTAADWNQTSTSSASYVKNKPTMAWATTTRSLNTAFQVSTTRAAFVSYTVDISSTLSLLAGETGTVILEYADDSGFTTNVVTVQSAANGNTGALTLGLNLTQTATGSLTGMVPAGKYVRLRTVNTTGTPTFTYRAQQEVLMPTN